MGIEKIFKDLVNNYLDARLETKNFIEVIEVDRLQANAKEIQLCIEKYNDLPKKPDNRLVNANHLKQIYDGELPDYLETIRKLGENIGVKEKVFSHLRDSSYLDEVYKISDPEYLLTNVLILVYRTYLLLTSPELKKKNAQISSTIEEMAVLLKLEGKESLVFEATKHWILNWREEGFSQDLAKLI